MFTQLKDILRKPALYEKGTTELWTDDHISKGMLEAHLNPDWDGATRKHETMRKNVKWIHSVASPAEYPNLLDLGCGPGIYAEEFHKAGYTVSGMDFSERSIRYARNSALEKNLSITYHHCNYLTLNATEQFDLITLIYYDFGVLSTVDRATLLRKIYQALRPGGLLIFDVLTPQHYAGQAENKSWEYGEGGFFSPEPYIGLHSFYRYDEQNTILQQHIILTEENMTHINVWEHTFVRDELVCDLQEAGFPAHTFYSSIDGAEYLDTGDEMCVVAQK